VDIPVNSPPLLLELRDEVTLDVILDEREVVADELDTEITLDALIEETLDAERNEDDEDVTQLFSTP